MLREVSPTPVSGRRPLDAYYTPDELAGRLVEELFAERFLWHGITALDPHCGGGAWLRALRPYLAAGDLGGFDIDPTARGLVDLEPEHGARRVHDFLEPWPADLERPHWIIGNPPYRDAETHVRQALDVARIGCAFLLRLGFLASSRRRGLWADFPASRIWVLSQRPSFIGNGSTDSTEYALFLWTRARKPGTPMRTEVISWR